MRRLAHAFLNRYLDWTAAFGIWAIALSTMLESLGIPGTTIAFELGAGPLIAAGQASFLVVVLLATCGLVVGSVASYALGRAGRDVLDRYLDDEQRARREAQRRAVKALLDRYGALAVFLAQLFGPLRTWGSYPAGFYRVNPVVFIAFTALGGIVYAAAVTALSYAYYVAAREIATRTLVRVGVPIWAVYAVVVVLFIVLAVGSARALPLLARRFGFFTEDSR